MDLRIFPSQKGFFCLYMEKIRKEEMKNSALKISKHCAKKLYMRGICHACYWMLVGMKIITKGDGFKEYPEWLKALIRMQDAFDQSEIRHPMDNIDDWENILVADDPFRQFDELEIRRPTAAIADLEPPKPRDKT
jgi:hypothetical protein